MESPCSVSISNLRFSDGSNIGLNDDSIVVVVGPNNVGKTQTLKDIYSRFTSGSNSSKCIKAIKFNKIGSSGQLSAHLSKVGKSEGGFYKYMGLNIFGQSLPNFDKLDFRQFGQLFASFILPDNRLQACSPVSSFDPFIKDPENSLQVLYNDEEKSQFVSDVLEDTFGQKLAIDYRGANKIRAFMGDIPALEEGENKTSDSYVKRLRRQVPLEEQGHGIRGFSGMVLEALVWPRDITLIDEPEVFLHPPQAKALGKVLAKHAKKQLVISTHSSDILRGLVDEKPANIRIIRLTRDKNVNYSSNISPEVLSEFWQNPQLKYSHALEAIFHERCILVEAESDCRFYNFLSDEIERRSITKKYTDKIYIPCGGKNSIHKVSKIMHSLKIPTKQIYDIDILSQEDDIRKAVESTGETWEGNYSQDWKILDAGVRAGIRRKSNKQIKNTIVRIIEASEDDAMPKSKIEEVLKSGSAWKQVKQAGDAKIPSGQATRAYKALIKNLKLIGIHIVPVGELENFVKDVASHGPKHVTQVIKDYKPNASELVEARKFVKSFIS